MSIIDFLLPLYSHIKHFKMKQVLLFLLICAGLNTLGQQKLSFQYDGNDLYQFVNQDFNSPRTGALIAHYNLKPDAPKTYYGNYSQGISLVIEKSKVALITLVVLGDDANKAFAGLLPEGLLPTMSMKEAKKQIGDGAESRDKEVYYTKGNVLIHVYFNKKHMESIVIEAK
jgi:hypothetical protein